MQILQICNKLPFPVLDGGSQVTNGLTEGLCSLGHTVHIVAIESNKDTISPIDIPDEYRVKTSLSTASLDLKIKPFDALLNLVFSKLPYQASRFISYEFEKKILESLSSNKYDIIQLESIYLLPYISVIRAASKAQIILRTQNIETRIWELRTKNTKNRLVKLYLNIMTKRLRKFELEQCEKVDYIIPISEVDSKYLKSYMPTSYIKHIPAGINLPINPPINLNVSFYNLSAMNWYPNEEGMKWFLSSVWKPFRQLYPKTEFHLAGIGMPKWTDKYTNHGVIISHKVTDPNRFLSDKSVLIVPLLSGSGIRIKILEALAHEKVVICSTLAAKGIEHQENTSILIADTPEEFIKQMSLFIKKPDYLINISREGRKLIESRYTIKKIATDFESIYQKVTTI